MRASVSNREVAVNGYRKFGEENWKKWTPVLCAGFACGMGLMGMAAIAVVLAAKSVIAAPF
jgi:hypothetical protein